MDKETIKELKRQSKEIDKEDRIEYYNKIYHLYGKDMFDKVAPRSYKRIDIGMLLEEGKFQDIYFKYGEKEYNKYLAYMKQQDIVYETGSKARGIASRVRSGIKDIVTKRIPSLLVSVGIALPIGSTIVSEKIKTEEYMENAEKIEEYIEHVNDYGKEISKLNLNQIETLMKVTDDMWKNIKGYGNPEIDLFTYAGLDLATEEGQGVCRNMADDIARKLNAIDEKYNARVITVYFDTEKRGYKNADISQTVIESNETVIEDNSKVDEEPDELFIKVVGNHAVVALESIEDNATLILDPTNPGIGVYKDGEIIMFNAEGYKEEQKLKLERTYFRPIVFEGVNGLKIPFEIVNTFRKSNLTLDELKQKYGLEAQNKALESIREKSKTFKDIIRVELENGDVIELPKDNQQENIKENDDIEK